MRDLLYKTLVALRALPPPQPLTWESVFGSSGSLLAGVAIDESNALNYSPVWCGVSTLSRDIAKLPLCFYRNLPNGGKELFKNHRLYRILHDEPNPEMTSFKFRETMQALCILYGNSYAEIVRDDLLKPAGMYPIVPTRVAPMRSDAGRLFYRVTNYNGKFSDVAAANMIHLSSLSTDGIIGHGIVAHARESFGLGVAIERFDAAFYGNGSTFGGVVEVPASLKGPQGEETKENVRKAIEAVHAGVERAHKILVLGAGSKFTQRGTAPKDAQMLENRKFQIAEVARWLTMPNHKLGDLENAHFTNIEEQELQYYIGTVSGWLKMWEQELTRKLIAPLEYNQQTIEHNMEGVLRGNSTQRAEYYAKMHAIGAYSINDILRKENMNPIGPEGDMHLVPLNMVPAERYNEWIDVELKSKQQKALPPAQSPAPDSARMDELIAEIRSATARAEEHVMRAIAAEAKAAQETEQAAVFQAVAEQERTAAAMAAEELRVAREAVAAAEEARTRAQDEQVAAIRARDDAQRLATETESAKLDIEQQSQAVAERADADARALQDALTNAQAAHVAVMEEKAAETRQREEAQRVAAEAETAKADAEQRAQVSASQVEAAEQQLAEAVTQSTAATQRADASEAEKAAVLADAQEARRMLAEREVILERAERELREATAHVTETRAQVAELDTRLQARKADEIDRLTRVVAAHRALIVDVVTRLLRPEVDRARRRQVTPESLRKWVEAFYQTHRDVCADALYPAVLTHLAWKRSDEDPRSVARALAETHCAQSESQLLALLTRAEPDEFHGELEKLLLRWEQERPAAVADSILADEIRYIGSLS